MNRMRRNFWIIPPESFLQIEVLSRIHHPNMVLLLGTCPERGCLVYEYMENGSLEDQLFHRVQELLFHGLSAFELLQK
jgi:serine/threonine protein kinase